MRVRAVAVVVGVALLVAGCGDDDDDDVATDTSGATTETSATSAPPATDVVDTTPATDGGTPATDAAAATTTTAAPTTTSSAPGVAWLREGAFADQAFGVGTLDAAVALAADELGEPTDDLVVDCDGGSSRQVGWEVLTLSGDPATGAVTGWDHRGGEPALVGPQGLGIGTTVAELRTLFPAVEVLEATLGPEFVSVSPEGGTVGGFLTSVDDDGTVTRFYAGFLCAFR